MFKKNSIWIEIIGRRRSPRRRSVLPRWIHNHWDEVEEAVEIIAMPACVRNGHHQWRDRGRRCDDPTQGAYGHRIQSKKKRKHDEDGGSEHAGNVNITAKNRASEGAACSNVLHNLFLESRRFLFHLSFYYSHTQTTDGGNLAELNYLRSYNV